jgi:SpoVK/Ycf46/Vps4 family AAA+-type ATPase
MQDRRGDVFIVATANDIGALRPEFVRKGRFDEIFFIDLPSEDARCAIFHLHLARRGQGTAGFDLRALADASEGFSGAEIEQAIVAGLFNAFNAGRALDTAALLAEVRATVPLSRTMADRFAVLRDWAATRTVSAA